MSTFLVLNKAFLSSEQAAYNPDIERLVVDLDNVNDSQRVKAVLASVVRCSPSLFAMELSYNTQLHFPISPVFCVLGNLRILKLYNFVPTGDDSRLLKRVLKPSRLKQMWVINENAHAEHSLEFVDLVTFLLQFKYFKIQDPYNYYTTFNYMQSSTFGDAFSAEQNQEAYWRLVYKNKTVSASYRISPGAQEVRRESMVSLLRAKGKWKSLKENFIRSHYTWWMRTVPENTFFRMLVNGC